MTDDLYNRNAAKLEDFWERRAHAWNSRRLFYVFGWPVELSSNHEGLLDAADFSIPQYSNVPPLERDPFRIHFVVRANEIDPGPPPENLPPLVRFTGASEWVHLDLQQWGQCFADLRAGDAKVVLSPRLAERPDLVSRAILNTLLNNFLTYHGYAMLHATGLMRDNRLLMLMAPHNSGKSTTALRLTFSRQFQLLSDSQIYITQTENGTQLTGFPVGRGKLRRDMLPAFPFLEGRLNPEQVRDETKFVLDLRALDPERVVEGAVFPESVDWCLLTRSDRPESSIRPATEEEVWESIMVNSLHYDETEIWEENLSRIAPLVEKARFFHLDLGKAGEDVVELLMREMDR